MEWINFTEKKPVVPSCVESIKVLTLSNRGTVKTQNYYKSIPKYNVYNEFIGMSKSGFRDNGTILCWMYIPDVPEEFRHLIENIAR